MVWPGQSTRYRLFCLHCTSEFYKIPISLKQILPTVVNCTIQCNCAFLCLTHFFHSRLFLADKKAFQEPSQSRCVVSFVSGFLHISVPHHIYYYRCALPVWTCSPWFCHETGPVILQHWLGIKYIFICRHINRCLYTCICTCLKYLRFFFWKIFVVLVKLRSQVFFGYSGFRWFLFYIALSF